MITFIGRRVFFKQGINGGVYPFLLTSRVRGQEIAEYLGGYFTRDGISFDKGGVRIHLKPRVLGHVKDGEYIDVLDDIHSIIEELKKRPKIKIIAYNKPYYEFLKKTLENEVFFIPHQHINFENKKRVKNKPIIGGMTGKAIPPTYAIFNPIKEALSQAGIEFKEWFTYETRDDASKFYEQSDFQVVWYSGIPEDIGRYYKYPGKIINAASFGVPTIAQKIEGHQEMEGFYIPAQTYDDIVREAIKLQDEDYYEEWSKKLIKKAEEYHISEIAKLYTNLK